MRFQAEALTNSLIDEVTPLLQKHFDEIAHFKDIPLEPDFVQYKIIEANGALKIYTARDNTDALLGYAVFFIRSNPHYKSSIQAFQDILFIEPTRRGFGARFIRWCDEELKKDNIEVVYHHVKKAHNFGPLLERFGYELVDLIYAKRLKERS